MIDPGILAGFAPWIVFAIASGFIGTRLAAFIGLALALIIFLPSAFKRTFMSMDLFGVAFFVLLALSSLALKESDLDTVRSWSGVLIYGCLAAYSWATIIRGDPFTREYARRMVPKEYWKSSLFLDSTKSIAMGWSTAFLGAAAITLAGALLDVGSMIVYLLGIGCMVAAIVWHTRVQAAAEAEGNRLRAVAKKDLGQ